MRLYYFLGGLLRPFGVIGLHAYSYLTRRPRTRLVVRNEKDEILFVQTWLGGGRWGLPGGGVDRGEDAKEAALRELREETNIKAGPDQLQYLFSLKSAGHDEIVYTVAVPADSLTGYLPHRFEIKDARWFSVGELPRLEPIARRTIDRVVES